LIGTASVHDRADQPGPVDEKLPLYRSAAMQRSRALIRTFLWREDGATMVEYALMLAFIALVCVAAVELMGTNTNDVYENPDLLDALG
jgi:Flp pilus assembly pilin Flp